MAPKIKDTRLRDRLETLEKLPLKRREALIEFLDALINAEKLLESYKERAKQAPQARSKPARARKRSPEA